MQVLKHHSSANHSKQAIKIPSITHELYTTYKRMIYHFTYQFPLKTKTRKMNLPINSYLHYAYFCNINKQNPSCDEKEKNLIFVRYLVCFYLII